MEGTRGFSLFFEGFKIPAAQRKIMNGIKQMRPHLSQLAKEILAEFISTFILIIFGCGSVAQTVLSKQRNGTFLSINFAWGVGVTMGCYWAGGVSGAHMNPAVSLANAVVGRLPWKKIPFYWTAQMVGAFVAAACVYGVYYDALNAFDGGVRQILGPNGTAGIWATYPQPFLSTANGFGDQLLGTALLVGCVFAIVDKNNNAPDKGTAPVLIGLVVFVIGTTFGFNCGYAINPARDLGPRIFTAMAGWGVGVFTASNNWAWVPVIGSLSGGVIGAVLYLVLIEMHHEKKTDREEVELEREVVNIAVTGAVSNAAYEKGNHVELQESSTSVPEDGSSTDRMHQRLIPNENSSFGTFQNQNSASTPKANKKSFHNADVTIDGAITPNTVSTQL